MVTLGTLEFKIPKPEQFWVMIKSSCGHGSKPLNQTGAAEVGGRGVGRLSAHSARSRNLEGKLHSKGPESLLRNSDCKQSFFVLIMKSMKPELVLEK